MMKSIKTILLAIILISSVNDIYAQFTTDKRLIEEHMRFSKEKTFNEWDIMLGYGPNILFTDFTQYLLLPDNKWHFNPSLSISYQLNPAFAIDARFMSGDLYGKGLDYYFDGEFQEYTANARFYINQMLSNPGPVNDKWNFYVNLGFGIQTFRNRVYHSDTGKVLHGNEIEGTAYDNYFVLGYDKTNPSKKSDKVKELAIPIGLGVLYRVNRNFDFGLETAIHFGLEDNLDGVLLGATNDKYWFTSFNLSYKIGKKNKRHSKWTYRTYGFNIFGKKQKDPLEDEINQFERLLQQHKGVLRLQIDSIITEENNTKIYTADNTFPIYFMPGGETFKDYENQITMAQIAVLLKKNSKWTLEIAGFADSHEENPLFISKKRANTVKQYLISHYGISDEIIKVSANGNDEQLSDNEHPNKPELINIDKRVDIIIIKPKYYPKIQDQ